MESRIVLFDDNNSDIIRIRSKVFVAEQNIEASIDFDGLDEVAIHVLVNDAGKVIATARMLQDGHIGRIAVLKEFRKKGAGSCALKALINEAKTKNLARLYLGAQTQATGFYTKMGFTVCGDVFMEAGIEHVEMEWYLN